MTHVNGWLLALAFVLGLLLTLAFMIRRVKREVPVYGVAKTKPRTVAAQPEPDESKTEAFAIPKTGVPKADVTKETAVPAIDEGKTAAFAVPKAEATKETAVPAFDEGKTEVIAIPAAAAGAAGLAGAAALAGKGKDSSEEPYGPGSFRLVGGASVPDGWTIKGNEDSMLYHTTDSPSYEQTIAELWFRDEPAAQAAGFTHWKEGRKGGAGAAKFAATEPELPPGPHGPGSATPGEGGTGPEGWTVKGNEDSMLYHSTESPSYNVTIAEVWFRDVETAEAAGFNRWDSGKSQRDKD